MDAARQRGIKVLDVAKLSSSNGDAPDPVPEGEDSPYLSAAKAAKLFDDKLTLYEKKEIENYSEIYYAGQNATQKVKAPTSGFNDGYDAENGEYNLVLGDHIAYRYEVLSHLGTGAFGQVVKAADRKKNTNVAIKLIRNKKKVTMQAKTEVLLLEHIKEKDPFDKYGIVQMQESFTFREHICIVYELLGTNLYDHMEKTNFYPMPLTTVRKIAARMLVALTFLWKENIIHCDLKPENVLYKSDGDSAVKVADLGSACYDSQCTYTYIQSRFYRAPEIIMGMRYGRSIDMWSFGCILCELATGYPLFPGENEQDQLACIMEYLDQPPASMLKTCRKAATYFDAKLEPRIVPNSKGKVRKPGSKTIASFLGLYEDDSFVSFLDQFLCWDPEARVPPRQAMKHPWIAEEFVFSVPAAKEKVSDAPSEKVAHETEVPDGGATKESLPTEPKTAAPSGYSRDDQAMNRKTTSTADGDVGKSASERTRFSFQQHSKPAEEEPAPSTGLKSPPAAVQATKNASVPEPNSPWRDNSEYPGAVLAMPSVRNDSNASSPKSSRWSRPAPGTVPWHVGQIEKRQMPSNSMARAATVTSAPSPKSVTQDATAVQPPLRRFSGFERPPIESHGAASAPSQPWTGRSQNAALYTSRDKAASDFGNRRYLRAIAPGGDTHEVGTPFLLSARTGQRVLHEPHVPSFGGDGGPASSPQYRMRATTTPMEELHGPRYGNGSNSVRRRGSEALPPLTALVMPPSLTPSKLEGSAVPGSTTHSRYAEPPSRRRDHLSQSTAQMRRETKISTVPENTGHLPPV